MRVGNFLSKERLVNSLKSLGKLRVKVRHSSVLTFSVLVLILFVAFTIRLFPLRWEVALGAEPVQLHLSEFDPYFQFRFTEYIVKNGFISWAWPTQWRDFYRWYPSGINVAKTGFPGLPLTAAFLYSIISSLGVNVSLMDFCTIFPAIMGMLASLVIYFLGKDIGGKSVGLFAALFLALSPSYIQRTQVGFFDDETVGIPAFLIFIFLFLRAIEEDRPLSSSMKYALASGAALGYFCSAWGAAYYAIGVTVLFVFLSVLLKRYTPRLLLSYSLTFGFGLYVTAWVPKLTPTYLTTSAILPVAGVFALLCLCEVFRAVTSIKWRTVFIVVFLAVLVGGFFVLSQFGYMRGMAGKFISVLNPLARAGSPLIESVAEHRISAWGSMYYDMGIGIIFFVASFFFILRDLNDKNLFLLILGLTSLYFACSMVRLLLLMAPVFSLLASVGITGILRPFIALLKEPSRITVKKKHGLQPVGKEFSGAAVFLIFLILMTNFAFPTPRVYTQASSPATIITDSLPVPPNELGELKHPHPWLQMSNWMRSNLKATTVVCSWWDYGYWLTIMGNVTSLADNATINRTQIENVGFIFMANETQALEMLERYNAEYILVFTTFYTYGEWFGSGDEGKWSWMAKISGKAYGRFLNESLIDVESGWTDDEPFAVYNETLASAKRWPLQWTDRGENSTLFKLMSYGKHIWCVDANVPDPNEKDYRTPVYFEEAYFAGLEVTFEHYPVGREVGIVPLVCLYKINYPRE